jgi:hypothetical protein
MCEIWQSQNFQKKKTNLDVGQRVIVCKLQASSSPNSFICFMFYKNKETCKTSFYDWPS